MNGWNHELPKGSEIRCSGKSEHGMYKVHCIEVLGIQDCQHMKWMNCPHVSYTNTKWFYRNNWNLAILNGIRRWHSTLCGGVAAYVSTNMVSSRWTDREHPGCWCFQICPPIQVPNEVEGSYHQGSILDPLLFLLFINNITNNIKSDTYRWPKVVWSLHHPQ